MKHENPPPQASRPRIVVADGYTTNSGDLSWEPLAELGDLVVHHRSGPALFDNVREAQIVLTNKEVLDRDLLAQLPELRFISVLATGTNSVDLAAARKRGIVVSNVPRYSTDSVAQHVFALVLELSNRVFEHAVAARDGRWSHGADFSYRLSPIPELSGKLLGIVGYGAIGRAVARVGRALGMRIATLDRPSLAPDADVTRLCPDALFASSDVLTLHCPHTPQTENLVNAERLATMKPSALLINTARGALVDETALASALERGALAGAALDVLRTEPPPADHPLLRAPNCLVTPHLAWASVEARRRLLAVSAENVAAFLRGEPQNVVN